MVYYKLTNKKMQTHNGFQWKLGEWKEALGSFSKELCSDGWLHCYDNPLLAVLHNPIHANIHNPRLFEIEVSGDTKDDCGMKRGFRKMRLIKEIPLPTVTCEQQIKYGILCAKAVCTTPAFVVWADRWLSGEDRSKEAAKTAAWAAEAAWATRAAEVAAVWAAEAAAWAAEATAIRAAEAAEVAAWAAEAAAIRAAEATAIRAAEAAEVAAIRVAEAVWVAAWTVDVDKTINLVDLAEQAVS